MHKRCCISVICQGPDSDSVAIFKILSPDVVVRDLSTLMSVVFESAEGQIDHIIQELQLW
jgi:hypothetical protein